MITRKCEVCPPLNNLLTYASMTTLEHGPHLAKKRGYVAHYSPANLALFQSEFHLHVNEMIGVGL